jgi:hypothetical protein
MPSIEQTDIAMATELWEEIEHMAITLYSRSSFGPVNPAPAVREAEIAVMAKVISAARGIGRAEARREAIPPAGRGDG